MMLAMIFFMGGTSKGIEYLIVVIAWHVPKYFQSSNML